MLKKFIWTMALAFSLILCQTASADCGHGLKAMIESLKIDDAQKAKIKPVLEQLKSTMKDSGAQMMDLSKQINQQAMSANMDQSAVDSMIDKKAKMIGDMMKAKIMAKNQIFAVLNDQQKAQLQTMMKALEEKMVAKYKKCHDED